MPKEGTLYHFLLHKTQAMELCAICEGGWVTSTVWIDHEDLFRVHPELSDRKVKEDKWEELTIRGEQRPSGEYGHTLRVPCHYIYLEDKE